MSKVSDAYDALLARLVALYPDHQQMTNPYKIDENNEMNLRQSYGLAVATGVNTNRLVGCQLSVRRDMIVTLSRVVRANEYNVSAKDAATKTLFEDQFLLIQDIEKDPTLASNSVAKADYVSDNGLQFVFGEKDNYIALETVIAVEYFENLL